MANWGFVLVAIVPMLIATFVLRRLLFGKDSSVVQTLLTVLLVWIGASVFGMFVIKTTGFGLVMDNLENSNPLLAYGQPAIVVGIITFCMAWMRRRAE